MFRHIVATFFRMAATLRLLVVAVAYLPMINITIIIRRIVVVKYFGLGYCECIHVYTWSFGSCSKPHDIKP